MQSLQSIRDEFARGRQGGARHVEIATQLQISEAELVAAHAVRLPTMDSSANTVAQLRAVRLLPHWANIITELENVGEVMALTRNPSCVHEKVGVYRNSSEKGGVGLVLANEIDLRIFYRHWAYGFAVSEQIDKSGEKTVQHSLQFFDHEGVAVHKVFLRPSSDHQAYHYLVERFVDHDENGELLNLNTQTASKTELADGEVDVVAFHQDWADLRDTHDFFPLLKKHQLSRRQAMRLAQPRFAQAIDTACVHHLLDAVAREGVPIMVFVANHGMVQIHTGCIKRVVVMGPWLNVLDSDFNLHLREDHIESAWVVKKPTVDGLVTSVEVFGADGQLIAMFFGERKPNKVELCEWRVLVDHLLKEHSGDEAVNQ